MKAPQKEAAEHATNKLHGRQYRSEIPHNAVDSAQNSVPPQITVFDASVVSHASQGTPRLQANAALGDESTLKTQLVRMQAAAASVDSEDYQGLPCVKAVIMNGSPSVADALVASGKAGPNGAPAASADWAALLQLLDEHDVVLLHAPFLSDESFAELLKDAADAKRQAAEAQRQVADLTAQLACLEAEFAKCRGEQ